MTTWLTFVPQRLYPIAGHTCVGCGDPLKADVVTLVLLVEREIVGHVGFCCCDAGARTLFEKAAAAERRRTRSTALEPFPSEDGRPLTNTKRDSYFREGTR
jgi:hypothetical protein